MTIQVTKARIKKNKKRRERKLQRRKIDCWLLQIAYQGCKKKSERERERKRERDRERETERERETNRQRELKIMEEQIAYRCIE